MTDNTNRIAAKFLGKKISGSETYDPSLLVAVPRADNRILYNIDSSNLPFCGQDVWHAYEFSSMTENGIPLTRLLKIKYNCESKFIVESKSLKLYLNSFNMSRFGQNIAECLSICKRLIETDLSSKLETSVEAAFLDNNTERENIFSNFQNIMNSVDETQLKADVFKETPELIITQDLNQIREYYLTFDALRSNCRVTHQPDFGDLFIFYKSAKHFDETSLVKYLTSFRSEYHFHEECCEMIYKRLYDLLDEEDELFVCALYTRRGGIDISPARWSKNCIVKDVLKLIDVTQFARYGNKQ